MSRNREMIYWVHLIEGIYIFDSFPFTNKKEANDWFKWLKSCADAHVKIELHKVISSYEPETDDIE